MVDTYHWDVLVTYHWDVIRCFIWDLFETSWRRTDGTSSIRPHETSSQHTNKTTWRRTTETSWQRSTETLLGVSFETYLETSLRRRHDVLLPGGSNVDPLYGSQTLLNVNYFKKYTSRIFVTYALANIPQKFTNYLSEIKVTDPIFGKVSMNLFLVVVKF